MNPYPFAHANERPFLDVGGARFPIVLLSVRFDISGEVSAVEVCVDPISVNERGLLTSALHSGMSVRIALRERAFEILCSGYSVSDASVDGSLVCYTLVGGKHAFNGL